MADQWRTDPRGWDEVDTEAAELRPRSCSTSINHGAALYHIRLTGTRNGRGCWSVDAALWTGLLPGHRQTSCPTCTCISITDVPLQSTTITVGEFARDLVVIIDSKLSLSAHVAALCRTGFYHLRRLRPMLRSLTHEQPERLSRRSYPVAWITATHCSTVCPAILSGEFSPSRTPLLGFSLEPDDATISRRFCGSCTGCQFRDALTTN